MHIKSMLLIQKNTLTKMSPENTYAYLSPHTYAHKHICVTNIKKKLFLAQNGGYNLSVFFTSLFSLFTTNQRSPYQE